METLTKYEALLGELDPYVPGRTTLQKALLDAKVSDLDSEYDPEKDKERLDRRIRLALL